MDIRTTGNKRSIRGGEKESREEAKKPCIGPEEKKEEDTSLWEENENKREVGEETASCAAGGEVWGRPRLRQLPRGAGKIRLCPTGQNWSNHQTSSMNWQNHQTSYENWQNHQTSNATVCLFVCKNWQNYQNSVAFLGYKALSWSVPDLFNFLPDIWLSFGGKSLGRAKDSLRG